MEARLFDVDRYFRLPERFHLVRKLLASDAPSQLHFHNYVELFIVERGAARHWINGICETLQPGDLQFIRRDDEHAFQADAQKGCQIINLMIPLETAHHLGCRYRDELAGRFFWQDGVQPSKFQLNGMHLSWAIESCWALNTRHHSLASVEMLLLALTTRLAEELPAGTQTAPAWLIDACKRARDPVYLRAGGGGLAAAARRSHEHVCRVMRQCTGLSPSAFMNGLRCEHAASLLAQTDLALEEIAENCGWSSSSHFHKTFKKHMGTTPAAYRQRRAPSPI